MGNFYENNIDDNNFEAMSPKYDLEESSAFFSSGEILKIKNKILEIINTLSKYENFSLNYKMYDESGKPIDEDLNKEINNCYNEFIMLYPGFVGSPQTMIKFFLLQRSNLIEGETLDRLRHNYIIYNSMESISDLFSQNNTKSNILKNTFNKYKNLFDSYEEFKLFCECPGNLEKIKNSIEEFRIVQGIFCDIDGTLIIDNKLNIPIINLFKSLYKKGKKIQLWTAGSYDEKVNMLKEKIDDFHKNGLSDKMLEDIGILKILPNGMIERKILNKNNFKNSVIDVVIDDRCHKRFIYQLGIIPKHFINVDDLK